jgi:transposase InsO family protein
LFSTAPELLKAEHLSAVEVTCSNPEFTADVLLDSNKDLQLRKHIFIGKTIIPMSNGRGFVWIMNLNKHPVRIPPRTKLCTFELYTEDLGTYNVAEMEGEILQELQGQPETPDSHEIPEMFKLEGEERVKQLFEDCKFGEHLTSEQKLEVQAVLCEYLDVFSFPDEPIGRAVGVYHKINTGDALPIRQRAHRVSPTERRIVQEKIEEMLKKDLIQPSESPWSSPILLIRQKDKIRMCQDYRKLNAVTKKDSYPLPLIADYFDHLQGSTYFSSMDCDSAYHQVSMAREDIEKAAFVTPDGRLWEPKVLTFGLCNAPSTYQRLIDRVLGRLKWNIALVYIDDTIVYSKTFSDHLLHLRLVLEAFRRSKLTLKPTKCTFADNQLEFLGHLVSKDGISVNPKKVAAITEIPTPKTVKEVQSFVSLCSYYRKFIKNFAKIARPLTQLSRSEIPFVWDESTQNAFEELMKRLTEAPVLAYPDESPTTTIDIHTDACGYGIGATLNQTLEDGKQHPVAYYSRSLSREESAYESRKLECLAIVLAVEHFHCYIYGRPFNIVTDHHSLRDLLNMKEPTGQFARWCSRLQPYDFKIKYRSGKTHIDADFLSRHPNEPAPAEDVSPADEYLCSLEIQMCALQQQNIAALQRLDPKLQNYFTWFANTDPSLKKPQYIEHFMIRDDILYRANYDEFGPLWRLVIPTSLHQEVMTEIHTKEGAHLGFFKTWHLLKSRYYWPGMYRSVFQYIKRCQLCQFYNRPTTDTCLGLAHPVTPPHQPFHTVGIDFIGPFPRCRGHEYAMVFICHTTRYIGSYSVSRCDSTNAIRVLERYLLGVHSCPRRIVLDQGSNFTSHSFIEFAKERNIELIFAPPYHHQFNGVVERANSTLKSTLAKRIQEKHKDWAVHLHEITFAMNITVNSTTNFSPFYLIYGRNPRLAIDNKLPMIPDNIDDNEPDVIANRVNAAVPAVVRNTEVTQQKAKAKHDAKHSEVSFAIGDLVLRLKYDRKPGEVKKLNKYWTGPYFVVDNTRKRTFKLKSLEINKPRIFDADAKDLKKFIPDLTFPSFEIESEFDTISDPGSESLPAPFTSSRSHSLINPTIQRLINPSLQPLINPTQAYPSPLNNFSVTTPAVSDIGSADSDCSESSIDRPQSVDPYELSVHLVDSYGESQAQGPRRGTRTRRPPDRFAP